MVLCATYFSRKELEAAVPKETVCRNAAVTPLQGEQAAPAP